MPSNWTDRRVVITGLGVVSSLGQKPSILWQNLLAGKCGIHRISSFDASAFDSQIAAEITDFDPSPAFPSVKEMRRADRFTQLSVLAAYEALQDSGLNLKEADHDHIGAFIGSGIGGLHTIEVQHKILLAKGPSRLSAYMIPMLILNMGAGLFSMFYKLRGPSLATCSACATSSHALGEAWRTIKMGDATVMFAGGSEAAIVPLGIGGFCAMRALSTRNDDPQHASRPFDRDRDGFIMGEGAGVVMLEELEHARKRGANIYAELVGYGNTADAAHVTAPAPWGEGAARCMRMALRSAAMNPCDISYINAHGTSTQPGDIAETQAIKSVFGDHSKTVAISSTKGATGHMLGAAGAVEMIICIKSIQSNVVPPTINLQNPDPLCDLDYVPGTPREMKVDAVVNNSFGFGGHNASLIARRFLG